MEIDEFALRRISLAVSLLGIAGLFAAAAVSEPKPVAVGEIGDSLEGAKVSAAGLVTWRRFTKNTLIFGLGDGADEITSVVFSPAAETLGAVEKGAFVRVTGRVERYRGRLEIVAERVVGMKKLA